ncbi:hypothetical protein M0802_005238 [Mischocyttarus mexicanus]|nr:hypothetical protein M0802_005238 [Mischocyttarus mexicanus]
MLMISLERHVGKLQDIENKGITYAAWAKGAQCVAGSSATVAARRAKLQEATCKDLMFVVGSLRNACEGIVTYHNEINGATFFDNSSDEQATTTAAASNA